MTSLYHQIGVGCAGFATVCIAILFFESKRDRNAAREELNATNRILREERLDEEYNDPEKRRAFIEQKIVKRLCRQRNINRFPISISAGDDGDLDANKECEINGVDSSNAPLDFTLDEEEGHAQEQQEPKNSDTIDVIDNTDNICSVCLEPFCQGEEVAWSRELKCQHCFHSECLVPWLMKHGECPVCRIEFFNKEDFSNNSDMKRLEIDTRTPAAKYTIISEAALDEERFDVNQNSHKSFVIENGQVEIK